MKHIIENLTRRPVTLMGNSGKYYHLPPRYKLELTALEVVDNAFVQKLEARNVLAIHATVHEATKSTKESLRTKADTAKAEHKAEAAAKRIHS